MAFSPGTHTAAVADDRAGVLLFHDLSGGATRQRLMAASPGRKPSGIAFFADGSHLIMATASGNTVVSIDLTSGTNTNLSCTCAPTEVVPMGAVLRLNEMGDGPLWLVDPGATQPRVVFVPALVAAQ